MRQLTQGTRGARKVALAAVLALGSLLMWTGIPAAWLWLCSQASDQYLTVYAAALIGCPLTMAAWGWCLQQINRVYLRISGRPETPRARPDWMRALGARRERSGGLLETWMTISAVLAILVALVWFVFFGVPGNGAAPGAW